MPEELQTIDQHSDAQKGLDSVGPPAFHGPGNRLGRIGTNRANAAAVPVLVQSGYLHVTGGSPSDQVVLSGSSVTVTALADVAKLAPSTNSGVARLTPSREDSRVTLANLSITSTLTVRHNQAGGEPSNIYTATGADVVLAQGQTLTLAYFSGAWHG